MKSEISLWMKAPPQVIFDTVQDLSKWPDFLTHYDENRYLFSKGNKRLVKMSCRRKSIPISWVALQEVDFTNLRITFLHVRAVTRGMFVEWFLKPEANGTLVTITHDLELRWPLIGPFVNKYIINGFFIHWVATQTLAQTKKHVEYRAS